MTKRLDRLGQATTEMLLIIPLFVILTGGSLCIAYMCWQGIKVQQAANLAARIQGQERVSGGISVGSIQTVNGTEGFGDTIPNSTSLQQFTNNPSAGSAYQSPPPTGSVYAQFYQEVKKMFGEGEQQKLFIPPPVLGTDTDMVAVARVLTPPKILSLQIQPIELQAHAYGGEDTHMYGLPRWGQTGNSSSLFWQQAVNKSPDD